MRSIGTLDSDARGTRSTRPGLISVALALVTFVAFLPSLGNGFVNWDDYSISSNPGYQGLGWTQLRWMFTAFVAGHYMPLTWLTLGLDYVLWGLNPAGLHLTSLLLHVANAALFYLVARHLCGKATAFSGAVLDLAAVTAALFFALHPLRVESVAWASERRDVLSGFFFLLAILLYLDAAAASGVRRRQLFWASVVAYLCALASKSVVMTLPFVLILLDVYPLRRLGGAPSGWFSHAARAVWIEKTPYLLLSLAGAAMSYYAHLRVMLGVEYSWATRIGVSLHSVWFYVVKTVLPRDLSPVYELSGDISLLEPKFLASAVGVVAMTVIMFVLHRRWPAGLAVWTYYGITLAPVSGIVFNAVLGADRYSYLPSLGWALLVGAGVGVLVRADTRPALRPSVARMVAGAVAVWLLGLATLTWHQVQVWKDGDSLWRHAARVAPDCFICQTNRGAWLLIHGAPLSGLAHFQRALALRPELKMARMNSALALAELGMFAEAAQQYQRVLARDPEAAGARVKLAEALLELGNPLEARDQLERAMLVMPDRFGIHANLGLALSRLGKPLEAAEHFRRAIALAPDGATARLGLIEAYLVLDQTDLARREYEILRAIDPVAARRVSAAFDPAP